MTKSEVSKTPFEITENTTSSQGSVSSILSGLQQELDKIKAKLKSDGHMANFSQVNEFVGMISNLQSIITAFYASFNDLENLEHGSWIIDTGATTHMCIDSKLLIRFTSNNAPVHINLPDGSTKSVTHFGDVHLTSKLILQHTLFAPCFEFNLLPVSKLAASAQVKFTFFPSYCLIQDLKTDEILARGKTVGNLYVFDSTVMKRNHAFNSFNTVSSRYDISDSDNCIFDVCNAGNKFAGAISDSDCTRADCNTRDKSDVWYSNKPTGHLNGVEKQFVCY